MTMGLARRERRVHRTRALRLVLLVVGVTGVLLWAPAAGSAAGLSLSTFAGTGAPCTSASGTAPTCGDGKSARAARLNEPSAIAFDAHGDVYVADTADNEVRRISPSGVITTVAGNGAPCMTVASCGDGGPATAAKLSGPHGVAVDSAGKVYVADTGDNEIRMFTVGGNITKIAGGSACASPPACGDDEPAIGGALSSPSGVAVGSSGAVYVADTGDNEIRMFTVGGNITRIAGTGAQCSNSGNTEKPTCGDGGAALTAELLAPEGVAVGHGGNVLIADTGDHEIRRFTPGGMITTVAGNGTQCTTAANPAPTCGDGGAATTAQLAFPHGVAVDASGDLYVADTDDHEIRYINAAGTISRVAGTGAACAAPTKSCGDGAAGSARLNLPRGLALASGGRVYIADSADHKVRLLAPAGPRPPVAVIDSPAQASVFTLHHVARLTFTCREGAGGPGLQSCTACGGTATVHRAPCPAGSLTNSIRLNTRSLGPHAYTVTARSRDGQTANVLFRYTVQRFRPLVYAPPALLAMAASPCMMYRCRAHPGLHTAWENSLTPMATDWCANYGCQHRMDLLPVNGFDDNLFPFNPDWAGYVLTGKPPFAIDECQQFQSSNPADWGPFCTTQQVSTDDGGNGSGFACSFGRDPRSAFHGHANWEPATYEGKLEWFEHSGQGSDDDYSLDLHTLNLDGVTGGNNGGDAVHIEFDSDETIDHFDSSSWWRRFHDAVDESDQRTHNYLDGDLAEVTGLVGIDAAHTPAAELHPVYSMAVETDHDFALRTGVDHWAIFARNWGNEGYCSSHDHPLPAGPITVRIPWLNGARGVALLDQPRPATGVTNTGSFFDAMNIDHPAITERVVPGEGVLLTFDLSTSPSQQPEYWGTIDLQWTFKSGQLSVGGLPPGSPGNRAPTHVTPHPARGDMDVEGVIDSLFNNLSRKLRLSTLRKIPPRLVVTSRAKRVRIRRRPPPIAPLVAPGEIFPRSRIDRTLLKRSGREIHAFCRGYRNHVPGFPGLCRGR